MISLSCLTTDLIYINYHDAFFCIDLPSPVDGIDVVRALIPGPKAFIEDAPSMAEPIDPAEDEARPVPIWGSLS
jgi:hypothetical protein